MALQVYLAVALGFWFSHTLTRARADTEDVRPVPAGHGSGRRANVSEDFRPRVLPSMNNESVARVDNTVEMAASAMCPAFWLGPHNDARADFGGLSY